MFHSAGNHRRAVQVSIALLAVTVLGAVRAKEVDAVMSADVEPVVFWASDPVQPGEAVLLAGGNLGTSMTLEASRLPDAETVDVTAPSPFVFPASAQGLEPLQPADQSVKFFLPDDLPMGVFACRFTAERGAAVVVLLNRPDPWWAQGDGGTSASPGGWVRVLGKCLAFPSQKVSVLVEGEGQTLRLTPSETSTWSLTLPLPSTLREGAYRLRIHNGFGGTHGWSEPVSITVQRQSVWKETRFDVVELGADPTGMRDSTPAVKEALARAGTEGGGVVFFPRGRYMVTETVTIPRFTVLRGESRELAAVFWPNSEKPLPVLLQGTDSFGIEELSLYATHYQHFIAGALGDQPGAGNVFLRRLLVRGVIYRPLKEAEEIHQRFAEMPGPNSDTVRLGGHNIAIADCDFYGSGRALFLSRVRGGYVARNTFYNGRWGWYCISGSDGLIFEGNQIIGADLMSTGGGINCLDGSSFSQNVYFAHNALKLLHGWDREAMTTDAGGGAYVGTIASAQGRTLTLSNEPQWHGRDWKGAGVFIIDGTGVGQYRRVVHGEGRQVEVDREWEIPPDETSQLSITMLQRNYLFIGNEFSDATCAIQFYGISLYHIVAENKSVRAGGFKNIGMHYAGGSQPSWFNQFLDNEIAEGNQGFNGPLNEFPPLDSQVATLGGWYEPTRAPMTRCTIMRRNRLLSNARISIRDACRDVIVEDNSVENAEVGIEVVGEPDGVLLHRNRFQRVHRPIVDEQRRALIVE